MNKKITVLDIKASYNPSEKEDDDSLWLVKYIIRPISFYIAVFFAQYSVSANQVTFISLVFGMLGSMLLILEGRGGLFGCVLLLFWLVLDHVDGNLARYYKTQSIYGDFLDTVACYIVLIYFPIGLGVGYFLSHEEGGYSLFILLLAVGSSLFNLFPRLLYQKMKSYNGRNFSYQSVIFSDNKSSKTLLNYMVSLLTNIINPSGFLFPILAVFVFFKVDDFFIVIYFILIAGGMTISLKKIFSSVKRIDKG